MRLATTDNNGGRFQVPEEHIGNLEPIGNCRVGHLCEQYPDLLAFPQSLGMYHDDIEKSVIFTLRERELATGNVMGFVGRNETQLTISSRFTKTDSCDYFLHYMLQKVFSINLLRFDLTSDSENIWDFLLYLFPYYLKKAYSQGLYKAYRRSEYNDANVKGAIDVGRHLRQNVPFCGKVAYTTREHSFDNALTQLVRHTIEYIKKHPAGSKILTGDDETRTIVNEFCHATQRSYQKSALQKVIAANLKPVSHPYFTEYKTLQKICLKILQHRGLAFGSEKNKIYGLLFDGAWLWEEYLNTLLKEDFVHPENKTGKHRKYLFEDFQAIYPDFISKRGPVMVGDAKYMPLGRQQAYQENSEHATGIYYKTITYMYRFNSQYGFLLFPHPETFYDETYRIKDTDGHLRKLGLAIPQHVGGFVDFRNSMEKNEAELMARLQTNIVKGECNGR